MAEKEGKQNSEFSLLLNLGYANQIWQTFQPRRSDQCLFRVKCILHDANVCAIYSHYIYSEIIYPVIPGDNWYKS